MLNHKKNNSYRKFIVRIKQAIRRESSIYEILGLIWLAGPVTFLSLQGGFYIGYGKSAPIDTFIYFASYTIITAIFAIIAKVVNHAVIIPKEQKKTKFLEETIHRLFMLYFSARNEHLKSFEQHDRKLVAAWWSIKNSSVSDVDIDNILAEITGSDELSLAMHRIEHYRQQGYYVLMQEEINYYKQKIDDLNLKIAQRFPALAKYVYDRFHGITPAMYSGSKRTSGFIDRMSLVLEKSDLSSATGDDTLNMLQLAIEFLLGRSVVTIYPKFNGFQKLEEARTNFDKYLSDFRIAVRHRNLKITALITDTLKTEKINKSSYIFTRGADSKKLSELMLICLAKIPRGDYTIQERYEEIKKLNNQVARQWTRLYEQEKTYHYYWQKDADKLKQQLSSNKQTKGKKSCLVFIDNDINLSSRHIYVCAEKINQIIENIIVNRNTLIAHTSHHDKSAFYTEDDFKLVAAQIGNVLDEFLNISEPEEQISIDASMACDFGRIRPEQPMSVKIDNAYMAVKEIQNNRAEVAHKLASFLVRYLNVPLADNIIDILVAEYGASKDILKQLQASDDDNQVDMAFQMAKFELIELPNWGFDLQRFQRK